MTSNMKGHLNTILSMAQEGMIGLMALHTPERSRMASDMGMEHLFLQMEMLHIQVSGLKA